MDQRVMRHVLPRFNVIPDAGSLFRISKLVILRHGTALSNEGQTFGGWEDVPLAAKGVHQSREAGVILSKLNIRFDVSFSSVLRRAIWTQWHCLDAMNQSWIPTVADWRLNERHYGALQGMRKADAVEKWGAGQVFSWRRGFSSRPPMLEPGDPRDSFGLPQYQHLGRQQIPLGESLQDTLARVGGVWSQEVLPRLIAGKSVLLFAHGNSIRALLMLIEGMSADEVSGIEVPNAEPLLYEVEESGNRFARRIIC